jgi:hypothetical protein
MGESLAAEWCAVPQLWMVTEPAGPGRYTVRSVSSPTASWSESAPAQAPSSPYRVATPWLLLGVADGSV